MKQIMRDLHLVETNNAMMLYENAYAEGVTEIYEMLTKATVYCVDLETLWLILLTPKMFREN